MLQTFSVGILASKEGYFNEMIWLEITVLLFFLIPYDSPTRQTVYRASTLSAPSQTIINTFIKTFALSSSQSIDLLLKYGVGKKKGRMF